MAYQTLVTILTIPSGSADSNIISGSDVDVWEELTIYTPTVLAGSASLHASYLLASGTAAWRPVQSTPGTDIVLNQNRCVMFDTVGTDGYKVSGSIIQSGSRDFFVYGANDVFTKA